MTNSLTLIYYVDRQQYKILYIIKVIDAVDVAYAKAVSFSLFFPIYLSIYLSICPIHSVTSSIGTSIFNYFHVPDWKNNTTFF